MSTSALWTPLSRSGEAGAQAAVSRSVPGLGWLVTGAGFLVLGGAFLVCYHTLGMDADSIEYVGVARQFAHGHGLTMPYRTPGMPMTDFPPGLPVVLSLAWVLHLAPMQWARLLNAALFAGTSVLAGTLIWRSARSVLLVIVGVVLIAASPEVLAVHSFIYTEPLYLFLTLGCLAGLTRYLESGGLRRLAVPVLLAAGCPLLRFAGLSTVGAGCLVLLLLDRRPRAARIGRAVAFGALATLPFAAWTLGNRSNGGAQLGGAVGLHFPGRAHARIALDTLSNWLLPHSIPAPTREAFFVALVALAAAIGFASVARRGRRSLLVKAWRVSAPVAPVLGVFLVTYCLMLLLVITFQDYGVYPNARILLPIYVPGTVLVLLMGSRLLRSLPMPDLRRPQVVAVLPAVVLILVWGARGAQWVHLDRGSDTWRQYNSAAFGSSRLVAYARRVPTGVPIYSNAPEAVYLFTGQPVREIPSKSFLASNAANPNYRSRLANMISTLKDRGGVVVYWYLGLEQGRPWLPTHQDLEAAGLVPRLATSDGLVLALPGGSE